jgi:hypothetical protein
MHAFAPNGTLNRLTTILVVVLGLFLAGGHVATADNNEQPTNVFAFANSPGAATVTWTHSGDGVFGFDIEEKSAGLVASADIGKRIWTFANLQANTTYQFRVCAVYDANDTNRVCSDANNVGYASVMTMPAQAQTANTPPTLPVITGIDAGFDHAGNASMGVHWDAAGYQYDSYTVRQRMKAAPGAPDNLFQDEDSKSSGGTGFHVVNGLLPGTTYQFQVRGCLRVLFVITDCKDWGPLYDATTSQLANASNRPTPSAFSSESGDTWIAISWSVTPRYNYDHYVIQYQPKPAAGGAPGASMTAQLQGNQVNYTAENLTPGTTYTFTVQGCDLILMPTPGVDCATASAPYTAATNSPLVTGGGTIIGNLKATITVSPPTVTSGNSVTITGSSFPLNDGPVSLGYGWSATNPTGGGSSSGSGGGSPVTTVSSQGTFSATLTIPSDVPPTSVTISAQSKSAQATAILQVVAPSSKGTLTLTYTPLVGSGGVVTDFAPDTSGYVLSGTNFTPGPVTIFLDSPQGAQLATATVAANGTFSQAFDPTAAQIGGKYGQHTLVAVQNGAVQGQLSVTVDQPIHVG